ncbi:snare associated Golgi protein-domain-containing protein [Haematococcus lacustris]
MRVQDAKSNACCRRPPRLLSSRVLLRTVPWSRQCLPARAHVAPSARRPLCSAELRKCPSQLAAHNHANPDSSSSSLGGDPQPLSPPSARPQAWRVPVVGLLFVIACVTLQHVLPQGAAAAATVVTASTGSTSALSTLVSWVLHLDHHLGGLIERHGQATYAILFAIVFCETGLVLTPFLPGDSLLFAAGAFAGMGRLDLVTLVAVFLTSAILGDALNYWVGNKLGGWAVAKGLVKQEYVSKTQAYYEKYGGKTVVLARFVPIIRTFAPFVAGVGSMPYTRFAWYNVLGAVIWTVLFVGGGFFFGNLPFVQKNFTLVVLAIVAISVVPVALELMTARREQAGRGPEPSTGS